MLCNSVEAKRGRSLCQTDPDKLQHQLRVLKKPSGERWSAHHPSLREARHRQGDIQMIPEVSPPGEHQANGDIENTKKRVKGRFKTLKDALDTKYEMRIQEDHMSIPWLIGHAAATLNRRRVGQDVICI